MKIPTKKLKMGLELPVLGLGTWLIGGDFSRNPNNDDKKDINTIERAIEKGIAHIDTAESYADGYSEVLIGKVIKNFNRKELFIASKVRDRNLKFEKVIKAANESLKRLNTDYFDLYLIHTYKNEIPIKETIQAMNFLVKRGLVKNIGVSNFTTRHLKEAQTLSEYPIVTNQVYYNLIYREPETEGLLEYCQSHDIFLTAYRPLEKGLLAGKEPVVEKICRKYGKTPAQIALNWLISQNNVVTITKMAAKEHLVENLGAIGWEMDINDIEDLRQNYPGKKPKSEILPLR